MLYNFYLKGLYSPQEAHVISTCAACVQGFSARPPTPAEEGSGRWGWHNFKGQQDMAIPQLK